MTILEEYAREMTKKLYRTENGKRKPEFWVCGTYKKEDGAKKIKTKY